MVFSKTVISSILATLQVVDTNGKAVASIKKSAAASGEGRECLTRKKTRKRRLLSSNVDGAIRNGPDVGILGRCPTNQVCGADATSSIGGRCVAAASSTRRMEEQQKQLCYFTCPDPKFCECISDDGYIDSDPSECIAAFASSCRNGDYAKCISNTRENILYWKSFHCPTYECLYDGRGYGECYLQAYEEYYEFCTDFFLGKNDFDIDSSGGYCKDIIDTFKAYGPYYFETVLVEPNKLAKKQKLIENRFFECVSNHTSDGAEQYLYYSEGIPYAQFYAQCAQSNEHTEECCCQKYSEQCELYTNIGFSTNRPHCKVRDCCNNSTTADGNMTACFDLLNTPYENEVITLRTTSPSAIPSSSPSIDPTIVDENGSDNSAPDKTGQSQGSSASSHSIQSPLGSLVWIVLFATIMGFFILE